MGCTMLSTMSLPTRIRARERDVFAQMDANHRQFVFLAPGKEEKIIECAETTVGHYQNTHVSDDRGNKDAQGIESNDEEIILHGGDRRVHGLLIGQVQNASRSRTQVVECCRKRHLGSERTPGTRGCKSSWE